ncbi:MAG: hypothetical protein L0Z50_40715, partial [Verrucomicrobiales bacterium]|nr:hypothetical protein [Verrucomicrobiales bacterium]
ATIGATGIGAIGSNSHFEQREGEAPAEPTSKIAIFFELTEKTGFGRNLTLPKLRRASSK